MRKVSRPLSPFFNVARHKLYLAMFASSPLLLSADAVAGPQGGQVVSGAGQIHQSGPTTTIDQATDLITIQWDSYNLSPEDVVNYRQPGRESVALNFILDHSGSEILGQINANGQVVLVNPNGIVFGEGAQVNVGGLIASGLSVNADDFLNGEVTFSSLEGTAGHVINRGIIEAASGGSVTLLGREVRNEGVVSAHLGAINLAAGHQAVVTFDDAGLMGVRVTDAILQDELGVDPALVNSGQLTAAGGRVLMSASASRDVFSQAVNTGDLAQARSVVMHDDGSYTLGAGADVVNTGDISVSHSEMAGSAVLLGEQVSQSGTIVADTGTVDAGHIELHARDTLVAKGDGLISASSAVSGQGGEVKLLGHQVGLFDQAQVQATGALGGGSIYVGGDYQGENPYLPNAFRTLVAPAARIDASATLDGDGGQMIVWADDLTRFYGDIFGVGRGSGKGGFAEVSGKRFLAFRGSADMSGAAGAGQLLLDPTDIVINTHGGTVSEPVVDFDKPDDEGSDRFTISSSALRLLLTSGENGGSHVILRALRDINFESIVNAETASGSLTLEAGQSVNFNQGVNIGSADLSVIAGHINCGEIGASACMGTDGSRGVTLAANETITTTGTLTFNASDFINIGGTLNTGSATLTSANAIDINNSATINATSGDVTFTAGHNLLVTAPLNANGDLLIEGNLSTQGGDVVLNTTGLVRVFGDARTHGGNFTVGSASDPLARPSGFISYEAAGRVGTINTGTAILGPDPSNNRRVAGHIQIYSGGDVDLGALNLSYSYADVDAHGGAERTGSIFVEAAGDFLLGQAFNFNDTGPRSASGDSHGADEVSFTVNAGGKITLDAEIYDFFGDQRDALNVDLTAGGDIALNASVYTAGGNLFLTGERIVFAGNTLLSTARARSGNFIGDDNSPDAGWSTGSNITLTAQNDMALGQVEAGGTCNHVLCEGRLTLSGLDAEGAVSVTRNPDTYLTVAGDLVLDGGLGDVSLRSLSDVRIDVRASLGGQLSVDTSGAQGQNAGDIVLTSGHALSIDELIANGGAASTSGSPRPGYDGGRITIDAASVHLFGAISSQGSARGSGGGAAPDGSPNSVTLHGPLYAASSEARITAGDIHLSSTVDGTEEGPNSLVVTGRNITFEDTLGATHTLDAMTVNASESVTFNGSAFVEGQSIHVQGTGSAADRRLSATGTENHWLLYKDSDAEGEPDNTLNGEVTFSGFYALVGGGHNDTFDVRLSDAAFRLDGGGGENTLNAYADGSNHWRLDDDGHSLIQGDGEIFFEQIDRLVGAGSDTLAGNDHNAHWEITGAGEGNRVANGETVTFEGMATLTGGDGSDHFVLRADGVIGALYGNPSGSIADAVNTLTVMSAQGSGQQWTVAGNGSGSVTDRVGSFTDVTQFVGDEGNDHFVLTGTGRELTFTGGAGANSLTLADGNNHWQLNDAYAGSVALDEDGEAGALRATFNGVATLAGAGSDTLVSDAGNQRWSGGSGDAWQLFSADTDERLADISGMAALVGGAANDTFVVGAATGEIAISGGGGSDNHLNLSALAGELVVSVDNAEADWTLSQIQTVTGNGTQSTFLGQDQDARWDIDGDGDGCVGALGCDAESIRFEGFGALTGGGEDDAFYLRTDAITDLKIRGGEGSNRLFAHSQDNQWLLGEETHSLNGSLIFSSLQRIYGGAGDDHFRVTGTGPVPEISGFDPEAGASGSNTLRVDAAADSVLDWTLTSQGEGTVGNPDDGRVIQFVGIHNLHGSEANDHFVVQAGASLSGRIDGGTGENTLFNHVADSHWNLSDEEAFSGDLNTGSADVIPFSDIHRLGGSGSDSLHARAAQNNHWRAGDDGDWWLSEDSAEADDRLTFSGMHQWIGGAQDDRFVIAADDGFAGTLIGAGGDNRLTYTGAGIDWALDDVTAASGQFDGNSFVGIRTLESAIGESRLTVNDSATNVWTLTDALSGHLVPGGDAQHRIDFLGMRDLVGGAGSDTFRAEDLSAAQLRAFGQIDGGANSGAVTNRLLLDNMIPGEVLDISLGDHGDVDLNIAHFNVVRAPLALDTQTEFSTLRGHTEHAYHWDITGTNAGTLRWSDGKEDHTLTFDGFGNLMGGDQSDTFLLRDQAHITGLIDGRGGINVLDYSQYQGDRVIEVGGDLSTGNLTIRNINGVVGNNDGSSDASFNSTLKIADGVGTDNTWTIGELSEVDGSDGINDGQVTTSDGETFYFLNVNRLVGGSGNDSFRLEGDGFISGSISGGSGENSIDTVNATRDQHFSLTARSGATEIDGIALITANTHASNRLSAADTDNTWTVTGNTEGTLNDGLTFVGIQHLHGGSGADSFVLNDEGAVSRIDGGGTAAGNTLSLSASNLDLSLSLNTEHPDDLLITAIGAIHGNANQSQRLRAEDRDNDWQVTAVGAGTLNDDLTFTGLHALLGGTGDDHFTLAEGARVQGLLDGGAGENTLAVQGPDNQWYIGAASLVNGDQAFTGFQHLVGELGDNTFTLDVGQSLSSITGSESGRNTLTVRSNAGAEHHWEVTDVGAGQVHNRVGHFSHITELVGGEGDDTFTLGTAGFIRDGIHGTGGDNALQSGHANAEWALADNQAHAGELTHDGRGSLTWTGMQTLTGSGTDTLRARAGQDNHWRSHTDSDAWELSQTGDNADRILFGGMDRWIGGDQADNFVVGGYSGSLQLDAGDGDNRLEVHGSGHWLLSDTFDGTFGSRIAFTDIRQLHADQGVHHLTGSAHNNHWTLDDSHAGSLGVDGSTDRLVFSGISEVRGNSGDDRFVIAGPTLFVGDVHGGAGHNILDVSADGFDWQLSSLTAGTFNGQAFSGMRELTAQGENHRLLGANIDTDWTLTAGQSGQMASPQNPDEHTLFFGMRDLIGGAGSDTFRAQGLSATQLSAFGRIDGGANSGAVTNRLLLDNMIPGEVLDISLGDHGDVDLNIAHFNVVRAPLALDTQTEFSTLRGHTEHAYHWDITGINAGTLSWRDEGRDHTLVFNGFGNLMGGDQSDTFLLRDQAHITGLIDGRGGINVLDYSLYQGDRVIEVGGDLSTGNLNIRNINGVVGNNDGSDSARFNSTLKIADNLGTDNTWIIGELSDVNGSDGINDGQVTTSDGETFYFLNMNRLVGGGGDDSFLLEGEGVISGSISGGGGDNSIDTLGATRGHHFSLRADTPGATEITAIGQITANEVEHNRLSAANTNNTWTVTESGRGSLNTSLHFTGIQHLHGGSGADSFVLNDEGAVSRIDGGGTAAGNTLSLSASNLDLSLSLNTEHPDDLLITAIGAIHGNANQSQRLRAEDRDNDWQVTAVGAGTLNDDLTFTGLHALLGGTGDDHFTLAEGARVQGLLDGGAGENTLAVQGPDNQWYIGAASLVNGDQAFTGFQHLVGELGDNTFTLDVGQSLSSITGSESGRNTLTVRSNAGAEHHWEVTDVGAGQVHNRVGHFSHITELVGGEGDDTFTLGTAGFIRDGIHGTGGDNALQSGHASAEWALADNQAHAGELTHDGRGSLTWTGMQTLTGSGTDTLRARAGQDNHWRSHTDSDAWELSQTGDNADRILFGGMDRWIGGDQADNFVVGSYTGSVQIEGGGGDNQLEVYGSGQWLLSDTFDGAFENRIIFTDIHQLRARHGVHRLTGSAHDNHWLLNDSHAGSLGVLGSDDRLLFSGISEVRGNSGNDRFVIAGPTLFVGDVHGGAGHNTLDVSADGYDWQLSSLTAGTFNGQAFSGMRELRVRGDNHRLLGTNTNTDWTLSGAQAGWLAAPGSPDERTLFSGMRDLIGGTGDDRFQALPGLTAEALAGYTLIDGGAGGYNTLNLIQVDDAPLDISLGAHPADALNPIQVRHFSVLDASAQSNRLRGAPDIAYQWRITGVDQGELLWRDAESNDWQMQFSGFGYLYGGNVGDRFTVLDQGSLSGAIDGMGGTNLLDLSTRQDDVLVVLGDLSDNESGLSISQINGIIGNHDASDANSFNSTLRVGSAGQAGADYQWRIEALTELADIVDSDGINDGRYRAGSADEIAFVNFNILEGSEGNDTFTFVEGGQVTGRIDGVGGDNTYDASNATAVHAVRLGVEGEGVRLEGIGTLLASGAYDNRLKAADGNNHWRLRETLSDLNDELRFSGFSSLIGGANDDAFLFEAGANVSRISGGGGDNRVDLTALVDGLDISLDEQVPADLMVDNIHQLSATSDAGHTLIGAAQSNRWRIDGRNAGDLNEHLVFSGIASLQGGSADDHFFVVGNGELTGQLDGGAGHNRLDLHGLDEARALTLSLAPDQGADLRLANIQLIDAPNAAEHRLKAQNQNNQWTLTGHNQGQLNDLAFTGIGWLIGADQDDHFVFQRGASLSGYLDGRGHSDGNRLNVAELADAVVVYGESGEVRNIQHLRGNDSDTRLIGLDANNQWRLNDGQNRGTLNSGLAFEGVTDLQGGDGGNSFYLTGGTVTGGLTGGRGDDNFELTVAQDMQGRVVIDGGEGGDNRILITGGGSGYHTEYRASHDGRERMTYTSANDAVYALVFSGIDRFEDRARADWLRLTSSPERDNLTLWNQGYQVEGLTELTWRNKANLLIAAGIDDQLMLSGAIDVPGTLDIRNAHVMSEGDQHRLVAQQLRLTGVTQFGSAEQAIATDVAQLSAAVEGGLFLHNDGPLVIHDLDLGGPGTIDAMGTITGEGTLRSYDLLSFNAHRGDLLLLGDNRFRGELALSAENAIHVASAGNLQLGDVRAERMTLAVEGDVVGQGVVALETLNVQRAGDIYLMDGANTLGRLRVDRAEELRLTSARDLTVEAIEADGAVALTAHALEQQGQIQAGGSVRIDAEQSIRMSQSTITQTTNGSIEYLAGDDIHIARILAGAGDIRLRSGGAVNNVRSDSENLSARGLTIESDQGVGADQRLVLAVENLWLTNRTGTVALENSGDITIERLANNGSISLRNDGHMQLDGREGPMFDGGSDDAVQAGGTVNANYDTGTLSITITGGDLTALGPVNSEQPDLVARSGSIVVAGNIGAPNRPLVMYFNNDLFLQGLRSWPPVWGFGERPTTVDNQSTIQVNQQDLLRAGGEQMVEVENLVDIDPAVFTEVRNYFFDAISILMPADQRYEDDDQYSLGY